MNAPLKPTPPYTAQQLADMPIAEARAALRRQECAHMQTHHARGVMASVKETLDLEGLARVECIDLQGRAFVWECHVACDLCGTTGEVVGRGRLHSCPACGEDDVEVVYTDYDGNLIDEPAEGEPGELLAAAR